MKRLVQVVSFSALLLAGCSSNPWDDIPDEEVSEWKSIGVSPSSAAQFRQNGFTALDVKPWVQAGIRTPMSVLSWQQAGFTPQEAAKWQAKGFTLANAIEFRKKGLTVE